MAVSTIKYDQDGKPKLAQYRIVVLGDLDPHNWSKSDVYSPVMNLMHLRLLIALAVKHNRILKQGGVKQAFVQSHLPPMKNMLSNHQQAVLTLNLAHIGYYYALSMD